MLSVRNVTFKYGKAVALADVSLEAAAGQAVLVVGGSGSGKSALLDCIAGVSAFDGSIAVGGLGCRSFRARRLVGYVRDPLASRSGGLVFDKLSCDEHIAFLRRSFSLDADGVKYACSLLASFGLDQYRYCPAGELSASARRRLEIVMALASRPGLLLLDRPALGLDKAYAEELCASLLALKLRGTAVVIAVSDVSEIGAVWDVGYELRGGRIVGSFAPAAAGAAVQDDAVNVVDVTKKTDAPAATVTKQPDAANVADVTKKTDAPATADVPLQVDVPAEDSLPLPDDADVSDGNGSDDDIPQAVDSSGRDASGDPAADDLPLRDDADVSDGNGSDGNGSDGAENTEVVL